MVKEDRSHRDHSLNPRKHPRGAKTYDNPSEVKLWTQLAPVTLLSEPEMKYIQDVPRLLKDGYYANLGHAKGGSAILLASSLVENNLDGHVISVDLFPKEYDLKKSENRIRRYGFKDRITLLKGSTDKWADSLYEEGVRFRFIFVDADHSYEAVKNDFYNWSFLLEKGGWMAFHDTNQDFSHRALQETVVGKWHELEGYHVDRIRTFMKP